MLLFVFYHVLAISSTLLLSTSLSHMDSSAFQGLWLPMIHTKDPPLIFQHLAVQLFNFSARVARGTKALNWCLETLSGF